MDSQARYVQCVDYRYASANPGILQTIILLRWMRLLRASTGGTRWLLTAQLNTLTDLLERLEEAEQRTVTVESEDAEVSGSF